MADAGASGWQRRPAVAVGRPDLVKQWDVALNDIGPDEVTLGSHRKIWWRCEQGHRWEATVGSRALMGHGCPHCAGLRVPSLAEDRPDLAAQWHPTKNAPLTPVDVTRGSHLTVWWKCGQGHVWGSPVFRLAAREHSCPRCKALGVVSLANGAPELAQDWHPSHNGDLGPRDVTTGSSRQVWWMCEDGHEWIAPVKDRTRRGKGCPECSGGRVRRRRGSVAQERPDLVAEWHPTRNRNLSPDHVTAGSGRQVWWRCQKAHVWRASVRNRILNGAGCPKCDRSRRKTSPRIRLDR